MLDIWVCYRYSYLVYFKILCLKSVCCRWCKNIWWSIFKSHLKSYQVNIALKWLVWTCYFNILHKAHLQMHEVHLIFGWLHYLLPLCTKYLNGFEIILRLIFNSGNSQSLSAPRGGGSLTCLFPLSTYIFWALRA